MELPPVHGVHEPLDSGQLPDQVYQGALRQDPWEAIGPAGEPELTESTNTVEQKPTKAEKAEAEAIEDIDELDQTFVGALGSAALTEDTGESRPKGRFHRFAERSRGLKAHIKERLEKRFEDDLHYRLPPIDVFTGDAVVAKRKGNTALLESRTAAIDGLVDFYRTRRLYQLASKLGLASPENEIKSQLKQRITDTLASTQGPVAATEVVPEIPAPLSNQTSVETSAAAGILTEQDIINAAGETEDPLEEEDTEDTDSDDSKTEPVESTKEAPKETLEAPPHEQDNKQVERRAQLNAWLNLNSVLRLKKAIDAELGAARQEQPDADVTVAQSIVRKHLEEYFGLPTDELAKGTEVPLWVQDRVQVLVDKSTGELEALRAPQTKSPKKK
ncbi:MAG: hypothetical protein JWS12_964 [Candidatus Saccharibacteria bacterium]|nr:hypothetical protein [Candidatus Saccharibacteria bacterium]